MALTNQQPDVVPAYELLGEKSQGRISDKDPAPSKLFEIDKHRKMYLLISKTNASERKRERGRNCLWIDYMFLFEKALLLSHHFIMKET